MTSSASNMIYVLRDVPGKGQGLVATEKISKGTRILCEEPIIVVPSNVMDREQLHTSISQQFFALNPHLQQAFLSMHNAFSYNNSREQYVGIVRTNSLPIQTTEGTGGIFLEACRINHACDNNAQRNWNTNIKRHTVHALRNIKKGEEITIYCLSTDMIRDERRRNLQDMFDFTCSCGFCSLPAEESSQSDKRLQQISKIDDTIGTSGTHGIRVSPQRMLRLADQQVHLYKGQGEGFSGMAQRFFDAARFCIASGDLVRGRIFVERAVSAWCIAYGDDCFDVVSYKALINKPSKHPMYQSSGKWKTGVDEVPSGLKSKAFEDWLWRRTQANCANCGVQATLRCTGCLDAPQYQSDEPVDVFYCKRTCQTIDWPHHKAQCNVMQNRKKMLRVATILKATALAYRECVFNFDIESVDFRNNVLRIHQRKNPNRTYLTKFPSKLTDNAGHKEAALLNRQSTLTMCLLGPLARKLLKGVSSTITQIDLSVGKPAFSTTLVLNALLSLPHVPQHRVLIAELKNNETANERWIIDIAGCQFGFHDVLVPFDKYIEHKACYDIMEPQPYNATETQDVDHSLSISSVVNNPQSRINLMWERAARLHFADFVRKRFEKFKGSFGKEMLSGSLSHFQSSLGGFIEQLKVHMTGFVKQHRTESRTETQWLQGIKCF